MSAISFFIVSIFLYYANAATVNTINKCQFPVWVGVFGTQQTPNEGGWKLNPGEHKSVNIKVRGEWNGRFWGRTDCNEQTGRCSTGSCGGTGIHCKGTTGETPSTLAEITFNGAGGLDYYDVSLVDGFNLPMKMRPIAGNFSKGTNQKYNCTEAGCTRDLNPSCPNELAVQVDRKVVACKSACAAFNTDAFCCRGAHSTPETCPPNEYSKIFKQACPNAYSYAYDDTTSTFTCKTGANYEVQFC